MNIKVLALFLFAAIGSASRRYYDNRMGRRGGREVYVIEAPSSEDEGYYYPPPLPPNPITPPMMTLPPDYYNPQMAPQAAYRNELQPKEIKHIIHSTKIIKDCNRKNEYYSTPPPVSPVPVPVREIVYQSPQPQPPQNVIIKHVVERAPLQQITTGSTVLEEEEDLERIERRFNEHREKALREIMAMFDTARLVTDPKEAREYDKNREKIKEQMEFMLTQMRTSFMLAVEEKRKARSGIF